MLLPEPRVEMPSIQGAARVPESGSEESVGATVSSFNLDTFKKRIFEILEKPKKFWPFKVAQIFVGPKTQPVIQKRMLKSNHSVQKIKI